MHLQGDNAYNLENGVQSVLTNSGYWAAGVAYCSFLDVFTTNHHFIWWVGVYVSNLGKDGGRRLRGHGHLRGRIRYVCGVFIFAI